MSVTAVLALADGTIFRGQSIGAKGNTTGEVVFNTALTGYQEILTDPSYARPLAHDRERVELGRKVRTDAEVS